MREGLRKAIPRPFGAIPGAVTFNSPAAPASCPSDEAGQVPRDKMAHTGHKRHHTGTAEARQGLLMVTAPGISPGIRPDGACASSHYFWRQPGHSPSSSFSHVSIARASISRRSPMALPSLSTTSPVTMTATAPDPFVCGTAISPETEAIEPGVVPVDSCITRETLINLGFLLDRPPFRLSPPCLSRFDKSITMAMSGFFAASSTASVPTP